jgi:hypothetical protein
MNAIFDFKRTGLLIQRYYIERFYGELMFWGISIIFMMFLRYNFFGIWGFAIGACMVRSGFVFREIHSPTNRINYFMIPATLIEKFAASLLYAIIYFWTMMFVVYIVGNILGTYANNLLANTFISNILDLDYQDLNWIVFDTTRNVSLNFGDFNTSLEVIVGILIIQSIFLLGSVYFTKNSFFKTVLTLAAIGFFLALISIFEANYFFSDTDKMLGRLTENELRLIKEDVMKPVETMLSIFLYLLVPYLWTVIYIRLTEKEV